MIGLLLDSGIIGLLLHPTTSQESLAARQWFSTLPKSLDIVVAEIVDYEYRRKLPHVGSLNRLRAYDVFLSRLHTEPITTASMRVAAALWAEARRAGLRTAGDNAIDIDMILIAQARLVAGRLGTDSIIATTNVRHLGRFTDARLWRDIV